MNRTEALLFGALIAVAGLTPAAEGAQAIKLTVPSTEVEQAAFFIAAQKGYFAAEGLDVELVFAGGGVSTPALMSGTIQGSGSSASALSPILRGAPLRIVMVFEDTPAYKIWATPDIHTLADLKGKSVGINTRGDTFEIATRLALKAAGIPPDAVGFTPLGFAGAGAALASGALPAVVLSTASAIAMQDQGQLKNAHVLADYFHKVHMPYAGFAVSEKLLTDYPILAKRIVRAIVKGMRYEKRFKNGTVAILAKYQKPPHIHASEVQYDEFESAVTRDLTVSDEVIASDLEVRAALLGIAKDQIPPIDKIYDFSIVRAVNAELNASHWVPTR